MPSLPKLEQECFFIAPIGRDGSEERHRSDDVLEFIVGRAAAELGLQAVRADQLAEPGQITLQVIEHVLGAKAAVADLTGRNPNVYYELAIRHTAKLPTVLICEQGEDLPFDIVQMRTIFFSHTDMRSVDRCWTEIVRHLGEALDGAVDSPVAASVDLQRLQAGNTMERNVAELVNNVSDLRKQVLTFMGEVPRRTQRRVSVADHLRRMEKERRLMDGLDHLLQEAREQKQPRAERRLTDLQRHLEMAFSPSFPLSPLAAETGSVAEGAHSEEWRTRLEQWLGSLRRAVGLAPPDGNDGQG